MLLRSLFFLFSGMLFPSFLSFPLFYMPLFFCLLYYILSNSTTIFPDENAKTIAFANFLSNSADVILIANIFSYNEFNGLGNVLIDFTITDCKTAKNVMYYKDTRLNAPRSSKEDLSERIADSFISKLNDSVEDNK